MKQRLKESLKNLPNVSQLERAKIDLCQTTKLFISMTLRYLKTKLLKTKNKLYSQLFVSLLMRGLNIGKHLIIIKSEITYTSDFIYLQDDCPGPPLRPFYQDFHEKSGVRHERKVEPHPSASENL